MRCLLSRETILRVTASVLAGALLLVLALAASPALHAQLHSGPATHECAVTLVASGSYEHSAAPMVFTPPQAVDQFATIPSLKAVWVAAPFLGASIFEHAPPALS
jgi:hypothetical protein